MSDYVKVIRCRNCKYCQYNGEDYYCYAHFDEWGDDSPIYHDNNLDYYCADAELREVEE